MYIRPYYNYYSKSGRSAPLTLPVIDGKTTGKLGVAVTAAGTLACNNDGICERVFEEGSAGALLPTVSGQSDGYR